MAGWPLWPAAPSKARQATRLRGQRPRLVGEGAALADHDLGAVRRGATRVGQTQAVELEHVLAVGLVRPGLGGVPVAGPDDQLGTGAALAGVVQALAQNRQLAVDERPLLRRGVVAGPDVHLVAVRGGAAEVV